MIAAELEALKNSVSETEIPQEDLYGNAGPEQLVEELPSALKAFHSRSQVFGDIAFRLNEVVRESEDLLSADENLAKELNTKAWAAEHILNVIINDDEVPVSNTLAAIRFVWEDLKLISTPVIQEALTALAVHDPNRDVKELAWLVLSHHHATQLPPSSGGDHGGKFGKEALRSLRKKFMRQRRAVGPRGSILSAADVNQNEESMIRELLTALARPAGVNRNEVALTLGELGGDEVAHRLAVAMQFEIKHNRDEDFAAHLASALSNIGGPVAVEALLRVAEQASERLRLVALSGLESLATGGAVALTEYPEPAKINNEEMRLAYLSLFKRLTDLTIAPTTPAYVRHKADELLEMLQISLNSCLVSA